MMMLASSPGKASSGRGMQQLPTSPTHMAAMRGAAHQRQQASFDFSNGAQMAAAHYSASGQPQFMCPPGQALEGNMFLTPSPDSPGQWSSASPQSHSDWSEGIHSPPANMQHQQQLMRMQQQHQHQQQTDAVLI